MWSNDLQPKHILPFRNGVTSKHVLPYIYSRQWSALGRSKQMIWCTIWLGSTKFVGELLNWSSTMYHLRIVNMYRRRLSWSGLGFLSYRQGVCLYALMVPRWIPHATIPWSFLSPGTVYILSSSSSNSATDHSLWFWGWSPVSNQPESNEQFQRLKKVDELFRWSNWNDDAT
jgi:hypothetical protein